MNIKTRQLKQVVAMLDELFEINNFYLKTKPMNNNLTQEEINERFVNLQEFKKNMAASIAKYIQKKQEEFKRKEAELQAMQDKLNEENYGE